MAQDTTAVAKTCKICGAIASGSFCSSCGHELARSRLSWIETLPFIGERVGFVSTIGRILRQPVSEPLHLATTPAYHGHAGLLLSALAVWAAFTYFIRLGAETVVDAGQASYLATPNDFLFFIDLAVSGLIAWALFRTLTPNPVRFDPHVKLWIVLASFYLVAHVLVVVIASGAMLIAQESMPNHATALQTWVPSISSWIIRAVQLAMLVHYAVAFGRLWSMPAWQAGLMLIMAWGLAIYPSWWLQYGLGFCYGVVAGGIQEILADSQPVGGQL